jgi:hypothetical protein
VKKCAAKKKKKKEKNEFKTKKDIERNSTMILPKEQGSQMNEDGRRKASVKRPSCEAGKQNMRI